MSRAASTQGRVLVVEDDAEIREVVDDILQAEGYEVTTATNGQEALDRLHHMSPPLLILLDLLMPVMNGSEFLSVLRATEAFAALPVVVFSAWPEEAWKIRDQTQGFINKPIALPVLLDTVRKFSAPSDTEGMPREQPASPRADCTEKGGSPA